MIIKIVSDIHTECDRDKGKSFLESLPNKNVDVLIVAGDLTSKYHEENLSLLCGRFPDVVYVAGNHSFWHSSFEKRRDLMTTIAAKLPNLHWLDNGGTTINGQRFLGGTLWFPKCRIDHAWPDFHYIAEGPHAIFKEHEKTKKFLTETANENDIIVTHHLPSYKVVHPRWVGSLYNCYFVADVDDIIVQNKPKVWAFGHTHDPIRMTYNSTKLYCNPRGYPREGVSFDEDFVIDI